MYNQPIPTMVTIPQLAEEFEGHGLTISRIRRILGDGKVPYIKCGRRFIINREKFIDYLVNGDERKLI